jgi:hypothetical protein
MTVATLRAWYSPLKVAQKRLGSKANGGDCGIQQLNKEFEVVVSRPNEWSVLYKSPVRPTASTTANGF